MTTLRYTWFPFGIFDWGDPLAGDDPSLKRPQDVFLSESPPFPSSFEYPGHLIHANRSLTLGTSDNLQFMAAVRSRRIGAPSGSSPTSTTPLTIAGGTESRKSVSTRSGVSQGTSSRKLRGRRRGRRIIPIRYFPYRL